MRSKKQMGRGDMWILNFVEGDFGLAGGVLGEEGRREELRP